MKIMFVCHGNICRSPMAEFIMKDAVSRRGTENVFCASSALSDEEIVCGLGHPVYPPAREELERHGIRCDGKRAVLLTADDYADYDLFVAMERSHLSRMKRLFGSDPDGKFRRIGDYTDGRDVADPWYSGRFDIAYAQIEAGCLALLDRIENGGEV